MTTINITKEDLNKAIYEVITNKYKKDCREAHDIVAGSGYNIEKWNGVFHVKNEETKRMVCTEKYGCNTKIRFNPYKKLAKLTNKFDFVNCLQKPINQFTIDEYHDSWNFNSESDAVEKYKELKNRRWSVRYHKECIEDAKIALRKAIERYESDILYHTRALEKAKVEYVDYRKEINLTA